MSFNLAFNKNHIQYQYYHHGKEVETKMKGPIKENLTLTDLDGYMFQMLYYKFQYNTNMYMYISGADCRQVIGRCSPGVCNNGTCQQVDNDIFQCDCQPSYTGVYK